MDTIKSEEIAALTETIQSEQKRILSHIERVLQVAQSSNGKIVSQATLKKLGLLKVVQMLSEIILRSICGLAEILVDGSQQLLQSHLCMIQWNEEEIK